MPMKSIHRGNAQRRAFGLNDCSLELTDKGLYSNGGRVCIVRRWLGGA